MLLQLDFNLPCFVQQKRVKTGRFDPCGTVHITIGDGGNREGLAHRYILAITKFLVL